MAKFTASVPLNIRWFGNEISGAAGATHRIPDALSGEFEAAFASTIPGFAWVAQDESTAFLQSPIAQTDVTGLTASLADKYDKAGGTISGAVTVTGALGVGGAATLSSSLVAPEIGGVIYADRYSSLAAALTAGAGGVVFIPRGTYALSAALSVPSNTRLVGAGVATKLTQSSNTPIIAAAASASAIEIANMWIVGSATSASTAAFGVHVPAGCSEILIRDLLIEDCNRSVEVVQASRVTVERVLVRRDMSDLGAIDCNQATGVLVRGCYVESPRSHGVDFRETSDLCQVVDSRVTSPGSTGYVISVNCTRCAIIGNRSTGGQHGAVVEIGSVASIIESNAFSAPSTNGILVSAAGTTHPALTVIKGNTVVSAGSRGIWNSGGDHTVIDGNAVLAAVTDGIRTNGSNNFASIVGNQISGGVSSAGAGINIDTSADDCTVTANVIHSVGGVGIRVNAARCAVTGNVIVDADDGGVLTSGGIALTGSAHRSVITGNVSRRSAGTKQDYGVIIQSGATNAAVLGNILFENTTGAISDAGTGTISANNVTG